MKIGCLGDIIFEVTDKKIQTVRDVSWNGSSSVQLHERHLNSALAEFTGSDADTISFSIRVSRFLGVNPGETLSRISNYEKNGVAVIFMLGTAKFGRYKWLITKHAVTMEHFAKNGEPIGFDIKITLTEYVKS